MDEKILIIGSSGQIGTELVIELRMIHGNENVIATDLKTSSEEVMNSGPFEYLDVMDEALLRDIVKRYNISQVYLLAALLSATAEKNIELGWQLNTRSHSHVLDLAKDGLIKKIFWPSSIAVFGPTTPNNTPQHAIMEPNTVYGISKLAGERWNEYYFNKFGVDVRSLRYPGLIGWKSVPGGGTTDYAVDIFYNAIKHGKYTSFISENTQLPMMYMSDAIRATIQIMQAPANQIKIRSSYNLAGVSFSPKEIADEISKHIANFEISYNIDYRQEIADSWPSSINDLNAQQDWGWRKKYDLENITKDMIANLQKKL
ncbi:NAD-dependent epimerase/dehydratase family protein [Flavobacteriales bacterium]|jgi:nucleoside-diphosphate-sugar epimerase|nr:NAD-dependent epimerase/dehydratase family protein [Flavobacteriales bacterium]MDA7578234.1 NAD-dependent epimerase/dehydratase family protein [Flavobacteriales bacterium]MDA7596192.1 NAD-dependent epimerase/dehydratase family protein [Flavobacteriales bacterium]MDC0909414.1 NAD-dependent epimerase/dehydratase family protein [Flavobacteriales bacterium]